MRPDLRNRSMKEWQKAADPHGNYDDDNDDDNDDDAIKAQAIQQSPLYLGVMGQFGDVCFGDVFETNNGNWAIIIGYDPHDKDEMFRISIWGKGSLGQFSDVGKIWISEDGVYENDPKSVFSFTKKLT